MAQLMVQATHSVTHGAGDTAQLVVQATHGATHGMGNTWHDTQRDSWRRQHMTQLMV